MVYNMKNNTCLFRAMPIHCTDNHQCRKMLVTATLRLQKTRRTKYGGQLNEQIILQIMKLHRELCSGDYVGAYARLRHIGVNVDLCSNEMRAILIPTLKCIMEDPFS